MRLPLLKAVSATAIAILPLLAPALGGLALTPGLTTAALACTNKSTVLMIGQCNDAVISTRKPANPCANRDIGDPRLQRGKCNVAPVVVGHDSGPMKMPSVQDSGRIRVIGRDGGGL